MFQVPKSDNGGQKAVGTSTKPVETIERGDPHSGSSVAGTATQATKKPTVTREEMKKSLRNWGIALIVMGIIHLVAGVVPPYDFAGFLTQVWGGIIVIIGILNLRIQRRRMFLVNGTAVMFVGVLNIVVSLYEGGTGWIIFGALQLWWGAMEIRKFRKYAPLSRAEAASQPVGNTGSRRET